MKKAIWFPVFRFLGVVLMLVAFPLVPDTYPWYYEVILFDIGLTLLIVTKWPEFGKKLGLTNKTFK